MVTFGINYTSLVASLMTWKKSGLVFHQLWSTVSTPHDIVKVNPIITENASHVVLIQSGKLLIYALNETNGALELTQTIS